MGKADRNRNQNARERIAAQQEAARRAEARRRALFAGGAVVLVLAVVLVIVLVKVLGKPASTPKAGPATGSALPASVQADIAGVPASTLTAVGAGGASATQIKTVTGPALTSGGKPEMLYIGAEWCPYCAAMRWAMTTALSRFGSFSPLGGIHSSATDVYANTASVTFYKSIYTSNYLTFTPVENQDVNRNLLQTPTAA